ncbi:MAG: rhodanese-related sulfurtransferase [Merismopedia sp. SIO2A8]|nr:rhodanese-related sulfurtransferase [Merismopedia sp. SIO2A8]
MPYTIVAFYQFAPFSDYVDWQAPLLALCREQELWGTILLASEGINGTVSGPTEGAIATLLDYFRQDERFANIGTKFSTSDDQPFNRLKVRLKKELVPLGIPGISPRKTVGTYVEPSEWNALISDPDVTLIDTRNDYEIGVGTFTGAIDPNIQTFRQFSEYSQQHLDPTTHKKVAMFCTGGIRCEKATSYLLEQGFEEVYHLKGGILKYLEEIPAEESLWQGECYVFDKRVSVVHGVKQGTYDMCYACGHPISPDDMRSPKYVPVVSCPHCYQDRQQGIDHEVTQSPSSNNGSVNDAPINNASTV